MSAKLTEKLVAKAAYAQSSRLANQQCVYLFYQPEMPEKVKRLKKSHDR